jgi:hypothetical protein
VTDRAVPVQTFQVQLWRTRVPKRLRVDVALECRPIGGDVVCDELTEERPAGRFFAERAGRVGDIAAVTHSADSPDRPKKRLVRFERGQLWKHPRVSRRSDRRVNRTNPRWR